MYKKIDAVNNTFDKEEYYLQDIAGKTVAIKKIQAGVTSWEYYINGDKAKFLTTQHERDNETGLDYRGARYYDSDIARFLSVDPLASKEPAWSVYRYCFDNPVMYLDPTGTFETRKEAKEYKKEHDIDGRIRKDDEGDFYIFNKSTNEHYQKATEWEQKNGYANEFGVVESTLISKGQTSANSGSQSDNIGFDGLNHIWAPLLIASGQKMNILKPLGYLGSDAGSSIASSTLSKLLPMRSPVIKTVTRAVPAVLRGGASTAVLGRAAGRFVPVLGWGLLAYDVVSFGYNNRKEITQGLQERQRYIDEGLMPLR